MTWGFQNFQTHIAEFDPISVLNLRRFKLWFGRQAEIDFRAAFVPQLNMASKEVSMKMRQEAGTKRVTGSRDSIV